MLCTCACIYIWGLVCLYAPVCTPTLNSVYMCSCEHMCMCLHVLIIPVPLCRELIDDFEEMEIESKTASILGHACKDLKTSKLLYVVCCERF